MTPPGMGTPASPLILPDYHSEENWNQFIQLFPEEQRRIAPSYAEAKENLDKMEVALRKQGTFALRVKVDAPEWKSWVEATGQPQSRESVGYFAMQKYVDQINERRSSSN